MKRKKNFIWNKMAFISIFVILLCRVGWTSSSLSIVRRNIISPWRRLCMLSSQGPCFVSLNLALKYPSAPCGMNPSWNSCSMLPDCTILATVKCYYYPMVLYGRGKSDKRQQCHEDVVSGNGISEVKLRCVWLVSRWVAIRNKTYSWLTCYLQTWLQCT